MSSAVGSGGSGESVGSGEGGTVADGAGGTSAADGGTALADAGSSAGLGDSASSGDSGKLTSQAQPALRIVKGNPTTAEVAALVAVFSAIGGRSESEPEQVSAWASPASVHRSGIAVGAPNAWVLSGR